MANNLIPYRVLIVEDHSPDIELLRYLLDRCGHPIELSFAQTGDEACDFIFRRNGYESSPAPELILLSFNIPFKDGRDLLRELKRSEELCGIPVVIMSATTSEREIEDCYRLGANAFISKPVDIKNFERTIKELTNFWFASVRLPSRSERRARLT